MDKVEILGILRARSGRLRELGVDRLFLFGSFARDANREGSDVDLLVDFAKPVGLVQFVGILEELEQALGRPVDLVDRRTLREPLKQKILAEAIPAA